MFCDVFLLGSWCSHKMATKVPIMSTAGAVPFKNEKGQQSTLLSLSSFLYVIYIESSILLIMNKI